MSSSFNNVFDAHNYFVWPNSSSLTSTYHSADTIDVLFITNKSPAYVSSNCSCNGFKSYFTTATPKTSFTFGAWGQYSTNGTQVLFDTTIDRSCPITGTQNLCFLTLHDGDGFGLNGWGTPLATIGYLPVQFDGQGTEKGILPTQYADPKPATYIFPPPPSSTAVSSASSITSAASLSSGTPSTGAAITNSITSGVPISSAELATTASTSIASPTSVTSTEPSSPSTSKGLVVGVSVGLSVAILLGLLALFLLYRRRKTSNQLETDTKRHSLGNTNLASDVALVSRISSPPSPSTISFQQTVSRTANGLTPEGLRDFIAAASIDRRTVMNPPGQLKFPGEEASAFVSTIWDAIAVRETYVSRLNPSLSIPTTLDSLCKQAKEISERTMMPPPVMLAATSTPWKGDTTGWSESNPFKHTFAFSGGTTGIPKKRLVVRRGESEGDGKKFETHETWATGNCPDCQCYLGATPIVKAAITIYVADRKEVEACVKCQVLVDSFKKLHDMQAIDPSTVMSEKEAQRAELARQAVEREWERMEEEYQSRENGGGGKQNIGLSRLK